MDQCIDHAMIYVSNKCLLSLFHKPSLKAIGYHLLNNDLIVYQGIGLNFCSGVVRRETCVDEIESHDGGERLTPLMQLM